MNHNGGGASRGASTGAGGPGFSVPGMSFSHVGENTGTGASSTSRGNTCASNDVECNLWFKLNQKF